MKFGSLKCCVLGVLMCGGLGMQVSGAEFETVILSGEAAGVVGKTLRAFDRVDLNNHGQLVFQAIADDDAVDELKTYANYYVDVSGGHQLIDSQTNDHDWSMKGGQGVAFSTHAYPLYRTQLNDHGDIAYLKLTDVWSDNELHTEVDAPFELRRTSINGSLNEVLASNQTEVPSAGGMQLDHYLVSGNFQLLNDGDVTLTTKAEGLSAAASGLGIYKIDSEGIEKLIMTGDPTATNGLPGEFGSFVLAPLSPRLVSLNRNGDVLVAHDGLTNPNGHFGWNANVTKYDASTGELDAITRVGDPAPGYEDGAYLYTGFRAPAGPVINDNGTMFLEFVVRDPSNASVFQKALYIYDEDGMTRVANSGASGGVVVDDYDFETLTSPFAYNNRDQFMFMAMPAITDPALSLYMGSKSGWEAVAVIGEAAAGFESEGYVYRQILADRAWRDQESVQLNDNGAAAFLAVVGEGFDNLEVLYGRGAEGELEVIAYEGMGFEVMANGVLEMRVIESFNVDLFDLNNQNMLAFGLEFEDGSSGIFTTMVPEPMSGAVMGMMALGVLAKRRRVG
ncbi:hypothetical protein KS4_01650 [Poriferisphaera corsica]|uniref:PEP-CTERM protein-sorting domain-containing protein n=1 Tax=Poriferisphaera corsica TaxID=2528020 RepID=A0A517YPJ0_9BACT|nr:hypothetical protein [Poriferisphaera corsica]QDU32136.1 hypothetical protein KS4_01650 [Poriferisphaera corsica]